MPVKIRVDSKQNKTSFFRSWKMGSCTGPTGRTEYTRIGTYFDRCCLPPGFYTLICKNDKGPFGWGNSFIEIQGMRYCDDFFGSEAFRRVLIKGKYLISRYSYTYILATSMLYQKNFYFYIFVKKLHTFSYQKVKLQMYSMMQRLYWLGRNYRVSMTGTSLFVTIMRQELTNDLYHRFVMEWTIVVTTVTKKTVVI